MRCCPSGSPAPHAGAHGHFPGRIYTRVLHLGMISSSQDGGGKLGSVEKGEGSCRLGVCVRARVWSKCQDVGMSTVCAHKCVKANDWEHA